MIASLVSAELKLPEEKRSAEGIRLTEKKTELISTEQSGGGMTKNHSILVR